MRLLPEMFNHILHQTDREMKTELNAVSGAKVVGLLVGSLAKLHASLE